MAKIEKTHRDSILRGRGYSLALGTGNAPKLKNDGSSGAAVLEEESMSPSGLLGEFSEENDDFLLDGADENMLLEDFDEDMTNKLVSF